MNNRIQNDIGMACGHHNLYIDRHSGTTDSRGVVFFDVMHADLVGMFDLLDRSDLS